MQEERTMKQDAGCKKQEARRMVQDTEIKKKNAIKNKEKARINFRQKQDVQ
jgi:hypothetical protein